MKHRIQITSRLRVTVEYAYDVEYDTDTGEAVIASQGHAVSHPDTLRVRELMQRTDFDEVDNAALVKLIDEEFIVRPRDGETLMHHGHQHHLSVDLLGLDVDDEGEVDPDGLATVSGEEILGALVSERDRGPDHRLRAKVARRRRKRLKETR